MFVDANMYGHCNDPLAENFHADLFFNSGLCSYTFDNIYTFILKNSKAIKTLTLGTQKLHIVLGQTVGFKL